MPEKHPVQMPTPETAQTYYENHEFYWLSNEKPAKSYTGKDHAAMLVDHKDLFGFTQAEIDKAKAPVFNKDEMIDRYLHLYELALERGWICIIVNKIANVAPNAIPIAVFWFHTETHGIYERIKVWLESKGIRTGLVRLRTIMMRSWDQPVQSLLAGAQFSKSGLKPTCQVCGTEIGSEELYMKGICPRCGNHLW
jgi:hypothetical protein